MSTTITTPAGSILPADDNVYQKVPLYNQAHLDLEKAVYSGPSALSVAASSSPLTLTEAQSRGAYLEFTGIRGSALTAIVDPDVVARTFTVYNNGTTQTLTIKVTSGGTGIAVANNTRELLTHDGTNVYKAGNYTSLSGLTTSRIPRATSSTAIGDGALSDDGTNVAFVSSAAYLLWSGRSQIKSPADGSFQLLNNAASGFTRLVLGVATAGGHSIAIISGEMAAQNGDGTAYATFNAYDVKARGGNGFSGYDTNGTDRTSIIYPAGNAFGVASDWRIGWSAGATTDPAGGLDTDLTRAAAAVIKAGNGSTGYAQVRMQSLAVNNSAAATTPGSVVNKIEVFDAAGVSLGFLAVYGSIA